MAAVGFSVNLAHPLRLPPVNGSGKLTGGVDMAGPDWPEGWDPFHELQREMGRLFQSLDPFRAFRHARAFPPLNLAATSDEYVLSAQLPGMDPAEVELTVTAETLTLRGERKRPEGVKDDSYRRQERFVGHWSRTVALPDRVDEARVTAHFADGILTVRLPRAESARPRNIALSTPGDRPIRIDSDEEGGGS